MKKIPEKLKEEKSIALAILGNVLKDIQSGKYQIPLWHEIEETDRPPYQEQAVCSIKFAMRTLEQGLNLPKDLKKALGMLENQKEKEMYLTRNEIIQAAIIELDHAARKTISLIENVDEEKYESHIAPWIKKYKAAALKLKDMLTPAEQKEMPKFIVEDEGQLRRYLRLDLDFYAEVLNNRSQS